VQTRAGVLNWKLLFVLFITRHGLFNIGAISYLLGLRIPRCRSVNKIFFRAPRHSGQASLAINLEPARYMYTCILNSRDLLYGLGDEFYKLYYNDHEIGCQSIMLTAILCYYGLKIEWNGIRAVICTCLIRVYKYYRRGRV